MNLVTLQADGRLSCDDRPLQGDPLGHLGFEVHLAPTCTLRAFFQCLRQYPQLQALNPFLGAFMQHYQGCPPEGCTCEGLDHLALWRTVEIVGHPGPARMALSVSLQGFQKSKPCDMRMYGFENLLDMPLKLGRLNHVVFGDRLNSMQFDTVFNLFELIDGICWQLSFHNLPATCRLMPRPMDHHGE